MICSAGAISFAPGATLLVLLGVFSEIEFPPAIAALELFAAFFHCNHLLWFCVE
jgi:hypothetical protein